MAGFYVALWVAKTAEGDVVGEYQHPITEVEYGPVKDELLVKRVDVTKYRNRLPSLPPGASEWVFFGACGQADMSGKASPWLQVKQGILRFERDSDTGPLVQRERIGLLSSQEGRTS